MALFIGLLFAISTQTLRPYLAAELNPETGTPRLGVVDVRRSDPSGIVIHYRDGYVIHHTVGHKRSDEKVVTGAVLDTALATDASKFTIGSHDDSTFQPGLHPTKVYRKSKGTDFAWFVDQWTNGHAVNSRPDHAEEHWLYLRLPAKLRDGKSYEVTSTAIGVRVTLKLDEQGSLSDSIHTNLLGYRPDAPAKFGYVYGWQGDGGSMDVGPIVGLPFSLVNASTGRDEYVGKVAFRLGKANPETQNLSDTPNGNFIGADVAECDFSSFIKSGQYYLRVAGVGRSRVFTIGADIYRPAFDTVMKGILGNRSGIALQPPFEPYTRPAPHNPVETPGFRGMLKYTSNRYIDRTSADADPADKPAIEAAIKGDLDVSGWYQDAGDWDSYASHIQVPQQLMLAYELKSRNFHPGECRLPDASALPDILQEARWLIAFGYRLRHELMQRGYGTGGIGLRICGDHFGSDTYPDDVGQGSWQDTHRFWTASGEDPISTFGYAGAAAQFALCLGIAAKPDPGQIDWGKEAIDACDWAMAHTQPGDEKKEMYADYRAYALAGVALLTHKERYVQLLRDATNGLPDHLWFSAFMGPSLYLATPDPKRDIGLMNRFMHSTLATADAELASAKKRALRWAGDWGMPMLIGHQTTPWIEQLAVASVVEHDPVKSKAYFGAICSTADYFLGDNPLNQTWVSGLGPQFPQNIFHMDGWYEAGSEQNLGIVPYGPWRKENAQGQGPWDHDWANSSVYPPIDQWPGAERWFGNRCCPLTNEFTIWQNLAPSAFAYGFLCSATG